MFNTQCCFPAVRFSSHKPVLRWTRVVRRPRVFSFFAPEFHLYVCFLSSRAGGSPQQSAMYRPEGGGERTEEIWVCGAAFISTGVSGPAMARSYLWQTASCWEKVCIRCPEAPCRPLTGWSPRSETAPPGWRGSRGRLKVQTWPSASRHLVPKHTDEVEFRTSYSHFSTTTTTKRRLAFIFRLFWDVAQLPQTFTLLWIPAIKEEENLSLLLWRCSRITGSGVKCVVSAALQLTRWREAGTACRWRPRPPAPRSARWWASRGLPWILGCSDSLSAGPTCPARTSSIRSGWGGWSGSRQTAPGRRINKD